MVDELAAFLVELSGNGVCIENLAVDTFSLDTIEEKPTKTVKAYLQDDADTEANVARIAAYLHDHAHLYPGFVPRLPLVCPVRQEDWANGWKQHFRPSRIGRRIVIKPTWEPFAVADGDILIELDPGLAFGTGTHPTTRMCLEIMEGIFFRDQPFDTTAHPTPAAVLDVGTGSGILSIGAAKCGAGHVAAIDIDERAVSVAAENLALNRVADVARVSTAPLHRVEGSFQIVLANILAEELVRLGGDLVARVDTGCFLVLSGILTEREEFVRRGFAPFPLKLVAVRREEEWSCLCYRLEP
jgi:ribosomal protein L11 methyltransferase